MKTAVIDETHEVETQHCCVPHNIVSPITGGADDPEVLFNLPLFKT